jgi:hypothetical protein
MAAKVETAPKGLIGCDLEYAVLNQAGRYIPAGLLPIEGVKGSPEGFGTGGIEIDCTAVELTFPPADTEERFVEIIMRHLVFARDRYRKYGKLVTKPSVFFDKNVLLRTRFAMTMGCSPDDNVWTGQQNPLPNPDTNFRTYGGHVHIQFGTPQTVKACDITLGMWSVLRDQDTDRKKMYGRAGAYRTKPYGVEYRVLSNFWCDNENYIRQVWRLTQHARTLAPKIDSMVETFGGPEEIQDIINHNRVMRARNILKSVGYEGG